MVHLSGFAGGQHVNDNKCGESVADKLTALCSEQKTIKGVLAALMRPLLTLGVLSMVVRVVEASTSSHSCHPWLSPGTGTCRGPAHAPREHSRQTVEPPTGVSCTRVTWQFADKETECANFLKRFDARSHARSLPTTAMDEGHDLLFSNSNLLSSLDQWRNLIIFVVASGVGDDGWIQNRRKAV